MEDAESALEFVNYTSEELAEVLRAVDEIEEENAGHITDSKGDESDIDIPSDPEEENSESENDNIPLVHLQREWRPATQSVIMEEFTEETGPKHTLPPEAKPVDFFKLFLPDSFFEKLAAETNNYAAQKIARAGKADPLWYDTTSEEMQAYVSVLVMMGIKKQPRISCYWSKDPLLNDPWISGVMAKLAF